jgi:hypothetical protein
VSRNDDRFLAETYANDEPVGVGLSSEIVAGPSSYRLWIPERLFARLQFLAKAYELHLLPVLDPHGKNELNRPQAEALADELTFINAFVGDDLLASYIGRLAELAERCARSPGEELLVIDGP